MAVHSIEGWQVAVARNGGRLLAFNDRCPHQATRLSTGRIRKGTIICPLHGARFGLADGRCIGGAYGDMRLFPCREVDGAIEVMVPDTAPTMADLPAG
jgi:anthranilate 1,2-dioxygenase ferredoxin component